MMEEIYVQLNNLATDKLKDFQSKLIQNSLPILGVKIPELRKLAKKICKEDYELFLKEYQESTFEVQLLYAFVISNAKMEISKRIEYIDEFVPKIRDWAVCDCFISSLKCTQRNLEEMKSLLLKYKNSHQEFEIRFVAVMLMNYYLTDQYVDFAIETIESLDVTTYYAKMGVAWFIATLLIHYKEQAFSLLKRIEDPKVIQYTIRKARDSFRVTKEDKELLLQFKK